MEEGAGGTFCGMTGYLGGRSVAGRVAGMHPIDYFVLGSVGTYSRYLECQCQRRWGLKPTIVITDHTYTQTSHRPERPGHVSASQQQSHYLRALQCSAAHRIVPHRTAPQTAQGGRHTHISDTSTRNSQLETELENEPRYGTYGTARAASATVRKR